MEIFNIIILSLSSLLLTFVGIMRLSNPQKTYLNSSGISLADDVNLLNEMRGVSAVMLCAGLIISLGIFFPAMRLTSFILASLILLGFGIGRLISTVVDGKPNKQIRQGIISEFVLGGANIFALINSLA